MYEAESPEGVIPSLDSEDAPASGNDRGGHLGRPEHAPREPSQSSPEGCTRPVVNGADGAPKQVSIGRHPHGPEIFLQASSIVNVRSKRPRPLKWIGENWALVWLLTAG